MPWLIKADLLAIGLTLICIMWQDISSRKISHRALIILAFFLLLHILMQDRSPEIVQALLTLAAGFIMFLAHLWGGGDAKLLALLSLSLQENIYFNFLLLTAFIGGLVAITGFIFFRKNIREHGIPYGIALSLAFMFIYPLQ